MMKRGGGDSAVPGIRDWETDWRLAVKISTRESNVQTCRKIPASAILDSIGEAVPATDGLSMA
jgi:hypothetical protein